jgi:hypothetical protein
MKKLLSYSMLIACLLLFSCGESAIDEDEDNGQNGGAQNQDGDTNNEEEKNTQNENEDEENNMNDKDIFDFKHIAQAPEATEQKSYQEVIKVFFGEWSIDIPLEDQAVGIDIANNEMHVHPIINHRGFRARGGIVQLSDTEKVPEILEEYNVQEWPEETAPDSEAEDGYSWGLWLQFEDSTVRKMGGHDETEKPDNFDAFSEALREYAAERMEE